VLTGFVTVRSEGPSQFGRQFLVLSLEPEKPSQKMRRHRPPTLYGCGAAASAEVPSGPRCVGVTGVWDDNRAQPGDSEFHRLALRQTTPRERPVVLAVTG
jgi:hypothetical protein